MQAGLTRVFPDYSRLTPTGIFGEQTYLTVVEFQKRSGLVPDGIVGPRTRAALTKYGIRF
jgi:peptidoglycan hydrolase-like protein with peptidoglycan-binding domain